MARNYHTSGGLWTGGNWSPAGPASGSTNTADFSTLVLPGNNTVHLNAPETIGSLIFGDEGNTYNWTLDNNGSGSNILTLGGAASITAINDSATVSAVLGGSAGLTVYGGAQIEQATARCPQSDQPGGTSARGRARGSPYPAAVENYTGNTTVNGGSLTCWISAI